MGRLGLGKRRGPRLQKRKPDSYANLDTLLGSIKNEKQEEFKQSLGYINNEDRLTLAEAIVARYLPEDQDEGPHSRGDEVGDGQETAVPTPLRSHSRQTQEQWLDLLLDPSSPDPRAPRSLAEELIRRTGQHEARQSPTEDQISQNFGRLQILKYLAENNTGLYRDEDEMKQTLFHIAAINGAKTATVILLSVIDVYREATRLLTSVDKGGYSPLSYAINKSKTLVVDFMLDFLRDDIGLEEIRKLLKKAIASSSSNNVDTMRELLAIRPASLDRKYRTDVDIMHELLKIRPASPDRKYRTDILEQDILRLASRHFNFQVYEFLLSVAGTVLKKTDCSLIHHAVYIGQVEAAKYLLKKFPDLATKLQIHPDHGPVPGTSITINDQRLSILGQGPAASVEVEEERFSVLALCDGKDMALRDLIFETLMERLPISELREHLGGQTWTGKEISLDVTILAFDLLSFAAFLNSVSSDMEMLEDCVRKQFIRDANNADEEPALDVRLADIPVDELPSIDGGGIEFERILKYVNIPAFVGKLGEKRTEAVSILQWLKLYKRVKRVFEITVDDCRFCPSTEEDIEMALRGLGVQYLDWRRTDLSIDSIVSVAKDVTTLHLYSSGSLAAIDHWIGPRGVSMLDVSFQVLLFYGSFQRLTWASQLHWLYIHIIQDDHVSEERARFCKKLCDDAKLKSKNKAVITIEKSWIPEPAGHRHHGSTGSIRKQSPIEVTGLAHFIQKYTEAQIRPPGFQSPRTKVAILDSGVNGTQFPLHSHERQGRSFVWRDNGKGHESEASWWLAVDPHGSQMANIISQLDPFCKFYFFQIADNMNYIELPTVIKALEWAIKCKVDFINCSFALSKYSDELEAVLRKARKQDIIIMCSTADEGENTDEVWPAAYYQRGQDRAEKFENIFPIVGCDEHGKFSKYANEGAGRYMFRGEDVDTSSTYPGMPIKTVDVQGSSVATAIATGVASLILACYRMVQDRLDKESTPPGLVNACFFKMSEQLRNSNPQDRPRLLVKASNFFPLGEYDILDVNNFVEYMTLRFNDIS
ncbi:hypothetical protein S40293_09874 [Stachybotrys chartarum IBT 40293]|nr:hypothetical protein S40293_09874 [Stachybotrys chartarum IBT 40293]